MVKVNPAVAMHYNSTTIRLLLYVGRYVQQGTSITARMSGSVLQGNKEVFRPSTEKKS